MKLIIPSENKSIDSIICQSFGRTPYYVLYDTEKSTTEFLDNSAATSAGGAGIKAAQLVADSGALAIITFRCGENAANVLIAAGIKLYLAQNGTIAENIQLFNEGKLSPLTNIHAGYHNHGGTL
jgi:predicted Fe-Mo cluster-binding NifX family protein